MHATNSRLAKHLSIGHGGWTIHWGTGNRLEHYGDTWKGHLHDLAPDAVGIDLTVIPWADLCTLSITGPMVDNHLPSGLLKPFLSDTQRPWRDVPQSGKDPRLGDANSLDTVSLDVYLLIARRFGARIFDPHQEGACEGVLASVTRFGSHCSQCSVCHRVDHPSSAGRPCNRSCDHH